MNFIKQILRIKAGDFRPRDGNQVEWILSRLLFALIVYHTLPGSISYSEQPYPNGIANIFELTFLQHTEIYQMLKFASAIALAFYVCGKGIYGALLYVTIFHISVFTLKNSQGAIHHGYQIVSLALVVQTVVYWYRRSAHHIAIFATQAVIAGVYLTAGLIKILRTSGEWLWTSENIAVQIVKSNEQNYHNHLRLDDARARGLEYAHWFLEHPLLARIFFGSGLILELLAVLALWNRGWGLLIGLSLIFMHLGIEMIMTLHFLYNEWMLWVFFVNIPFWSVWIVRKLTLAIPVNSLKLRYETTVSPYFRDISLPQFLRPRSRQKVGRGDR